MILPTGVPLEKVRNMPTCSSASWDPRECLGRHHPHGFFCKELLLSKATLKYAGVFLEPRQ
eukprot:2274707-Amphidinium_carterae.1